MVKFREQRHRRAGFSQSELNQLDRDMGARDRSSNNDLDAQTLQNDHCNPLVRSTSTTGKELRGPFQSGSVWQHIYSKKETGPERRDVLSASHQTQVRREYREEQDESVV